MPRLVNVEELLKDFSRKSRKERAEAVKKLDGDLKEAVSKDMAVHFGIVMSTIAKRGGRHKVHSERQKNVFNAFGWSKVNYLYRREKDDARDVFKAFGIEKSMTPYAASEVARLGVSLGSFKETHDTMLELKCGNLSTSEIRNVTLDAGEAALKEQENPAKDIRKYSEAKMKTPEGARAVSRTLVGMGDGTNAPCVKADTKGVKGKNSDEAGPRQLRALSFCEYVNVTDKGVPIPLPGSFSYAVTDKGIAEMTSMARLHGVARGYGTVERMQCVADGEEALEKAFRDAFPNAIFTNDFMHASGYASKCIEALGIENPHREYMICRGIMLRIGAGSVVDRIKRLYADKLEKSPEAKSALDYLDKRRENMNYGWLRKNGYYISSAHIEAAARILVARRCKQAGMHWRHHNAARVAALIAKYRSAA